MTRSATRTGEDPDEPTAPRSLTTDAGGAAPTDRPHLAAALRVALEGRHAAVWAHARRVLSEPGMALAPGLSPFELRARVGEQMRRLAGDPLAVGGFPVALGGAGDLAGYVQGFSAMAYGDLSLLVKVGVQYGLFGGAIWNLGTERHHRRWLPDVLAYRLPGCFAMSEVGHGSDVAGVRTTATFDPATDELVVHSPDPGAAKNWIGNAAMDGRAAVVFCQLRTGGEDRGVHAVFVPLRADDGSLLTGVTAVGDGLKMGLNGVDNGLLMFDQVRVPRDNLLDRFASVAADGTYTSPIESAGRRFFTMLGTLVTGRVSVAGAGLSVSKVALTVAVDHGLTRRQFSDPATGQDVLLLDNTAHQRRLLPLLATTYVLHAAHAQLVEDLDRVMGDEHADDQERRELETQAAGIKAVATWHGSETVQEAREACGGAGYLAAYRLPQLRADSDIFTTFEGDNTVLLQLVAKNLLVGFRTELSSMDLVETARLVLDQTGEQVLERTGVRQVLQGLAGILPGREQDLDEYDVQLNLLAWREEHLLVSVTNRLRRGADRGLTTFEVFDNVQDHALQAARAYVDRLALERAGALLSAAVDGPTRALLAKVVALHGVRVLERERGWFVEHGRLHPARAKALPPLLTQLSRELRPYAADLVRAFGVPVADLVDPAVVARHVTGTGPLDRSSVPAVPVRPSGTG